MARGAQAHPGHAYGPRRVGYSQAQASLTAGDGRTQSVEKAVEFPGLRERIRARGSPGTMLDLKASHHPPSHWKRGNKRPVLFNCPHWLRQCRAPAAAWPGNVV